MLGIGGERAAKRAKLGRNDVAALVGLVLKDGELVVSVEFDVAVVRGGKLGNDYLESGAVGGHPAASEQLFPVQAIDAGEQVRSALRIQQRASRLPATRSRTKVVRLVPGRSGVAGGGEAALLVVAELHRLRAVIIYSLCGE
jgi:hypothetical protein